MAKGKRAAALFEVIQAAKAREEKRLSKAQRLQSKSSGGLRTPSWWFKSKKQNSTQSASSEPIVSVELPPAEPAKAQASKPARSSLIASLLSRSKSAKPPEESQLFDPPEESDETAAESTEQIASEQAAPEPAKPMMRLADDIIDNEEALDFGEGVQDVGQQQTSSSVEAPESNEVEEEESVEVNEASESTESIESVESSAPAMIETEEAPPPAAPQPKPVRVAVNRQRQQLDFHVSYTSAAIGAFGFFVVVGMAFLIGKSFSHGPASAAGAASIESIRKGPAFPQVLQVNHNANTPVADDGSTVKAPPKTETKNPAPTPVPAASKIAPAAPQPAPAKPPVYNGKRIVGMQYVCIRSYPDPEDANDAVAVLKKAGIDATAEKGLWIAPTWTSVVGTRAFDHTRNNPEFDAYLRSIQEASDAFVGSSRCSVIGWKEQQN